MGFQRRRSKSGEDTQTQFLLEQEAKLAARLQSLEDLVRHNSMQIAEHTRLIASLSKRIEEQSSQIGRLEDLVTRTVRVVEERSRQTEGRIVSLVSAVERGLGKG